MSNKINTLRAEISECFNAANLAYIARRGNKSVLNAETGMQKDVADGKKFYLELTDAQLVALENLGVNHKQVAMHIANSTNVKKAVRIPMFMGFIVSGNGAYLKNSAQTAMLGFCGLMSGAKNRNGLNFVITGKGDDNTSDSVSITRARAVQKFFGLVGVSSAPTQTSVSFSKGGILPALNLCEKMGRGDSVPAISDTPLARALINLITTASDSKIELWVKQSVTRK